MSQSSIIAAFLLFGFIVFITVRGELPQYAAIVGLGTSSGSTNTASLAPIAGVSIGQATPVTIGGGNPLTIGGVQ